MISLFGNVVVQIGYTGVSASFHRNNNLYRSQAYGTGNEP
jgi:hypothetical protein